MDEVQGFRGSDVGGDYGFCVRENGGVCWWVLEEGVQGFGYAGEVVGFPGESGSDGGIDGSEEGGGALVGLFGFFEDAADC